MFEVNILTYKFELINFCLWLFVEFVWSYSHKVEDSRLKWSEENCKKILVCEFNIFFEIKCVIESIHMFHKSKIRYVWMFNILEIRGRCLELKFKYKL